MKSKGSSIKNGIYILKFFHKASPSRIPLTLLSVVLSVIINFLAKVYLLRFVINSIQTGNSFESVLVYIITIGALQVFYLIMNNLYNSFYIPISDNNIKIYFQEMTFKKAASVELSCYENKEFYDKYTKAVGQAGQSAYKVLEILSGILNNILTIATTSLLIFSIAPVLIIFSVIPIIYSLVFGRKINRLNYDRTMEMTDISRRRDYVKRVFYLADYAKELRLSNIHKVLLERFSKTTKDLKNCIKKHGFKISILDYMNVVIRRAILYIGTILYTTYRTGVTKTMLFGDCVIIINNFLSTTDSMRGLIDSYMQFHQQSLFINNLREFLEYQPKIYDDPAALNIPKTNIEISLNQLRFRYTENRPDVLDNISFVIKPGEKIAIVGQNGAGKSTIVKLLTRLYDPLYGIIQCNGLPITEYRLSEYRELFGVVFQNYQIFALDIVKNVLLTDAVTPETEAAAIEGLKNSGIYDKIQSLPDGVHTWLTKEFDSNGVVLSGGEAQKVALARVFAKPCKIVILDEPSSALDPIAEYKMYEAMFNACRDKSMIYISHRLSSAVLADTIYVIDNGKIIERGTHKELLSNGGKYAEMWHMQAQYYINEVINT